MPKKIPVEFHIKNFAKAVAKAKAAGKKIGSIANGCFSTSSHPSSPTLCALGVANVVAHDSPKEVRQIEAGWEGWQHVKKDYFYRHGVKLRKMFAEGNPAPAND